MSYSGGWTSGANGAPTYNFGSVMQDVAQVGNFGNTWGNETPEWDFPLGRDRVPADVQEMFLRIDAGPTGLNEFFQNASPAVIDRFRSMINMGIIRPKNEAASNLSRSMGGLRAGDQTILGPWINDMPSGLSPEYWQQANSLIGTMVDARMREAEQSGYFEGMPTLERERVMGELAQGWKQQFTQEFTALEQSRANKANEGLSQQEINNQHMQQMAGLMGGTVNPATGEFQQTEEGRQFDAQQSGFLNGQATLAREQEAFKQQQAIAAAASNPRDYIYAQMLGNARGGLAGQAPTNQLTATSGMQQPGGLPQGTGWDTMRSMQAPGVSGAGTLAQMGGPGMPPAGQDGQVPPGMTAESWTRMLQGAQQQQDQARQAMLGAQGGAGAGAASGLSPGPGSPGMAQPYAGYQGQPGQALPQATPTAMGAQTYQAFQTPQARPTPYGAQAQPQQFTTSAFTQQLLRNRMVPGQGAIQGQGRYMTGQQMQQALPTLNKVRGQDYLRGNASERAGFRGVASMAGFSDEDTEDALKRNASPGFRAPGAGRMI
jgi:hypothetical protein